MSEPSDLLATRGVVGGRGRPHRPWRICAVLVALGTLASPGLAAAALFEPIGEYQIELDGKVLAEGVRIFHSREVGAVLVIAPQLPHPVALVARNKTIQRLAAADIDEHAHGAVIWDSAGEKTAIGNFELAEGKPVFTVDGKQVRFLAKPPLLGPRTIEEIVAYDPSYAYRAATHEPHPAYLPELGAWSDEVLVKVFFSTQCQVCRELMPGILRTTERLEGSRIRFEFHGMPVPARSDPLARELGINTFPTGLVYVDGKEVGRAIGPSWRLPGMAIHHALTGIKVELDALGQQPPS